MRGVVSLAAALALPDGFPGRNFILAATFAVILTTVIVQGSTLAPLIKLLRLSKRPSVNVSQISELEARLLTTIAELNAVRKNSGPPDGTERHPRLLKQYAFRLEAIKRSEASPSKRNLVRDDHFTAVLQGIAAGRLELLKLHRDGVIDDTTFHNLENELDSSEILAEHRLGPGSSE